MFIPPSEEDGVQVVGVVPCEHPLHERACPLVHHDAAAPFLHGFARKLPLRGRSLRVTG